MPVSEEVKEALLLEAVKKAKGRPITYCGLARSWDECITVEKIARLWFNVGKNTHVVMMPLLEEDLS